MRVFKFMFVLLAALGTQFFANAHEVNKSASDSVVLGNITDGNSKKPMNDVTVSLSTAKQGKRELKSDATGSFAFFQLPPGELCTIQLEKKGYKTYRKEFIMTKEGGVQLKIALESEEDDSIDSWNPLRMIYGK